MGVRRPGSGASPEPSSTRCDMSRRTLFAGLAAVVVLASAGLLLRAQDKSADTPKAALPRGEFAGKVLFVQTKAGVRGATLENASLRQLGNRTFLVGKAVNDDVLTHRQYFVGAELWLPVDEVESIAAFENLGQLRRNAGGQ